MEKIKVSDYEAVVAVVSNMHRAARKEKARS